MTDTEILALLSRLSFVFAKTMPDQPHEYVIRTEQNWDDFTRLWDTIAARGEPAKYNGRRYRYLAPGDGWKYWVMGPKYRFLINRARVEPPAA